jgi:hypothetical protein
MVGFYFIAFHRFVKVERLQAFAAGFGGDGRRREQEGKNGN